MRAIEREANYRPFEGKARVFLVDDADKLNPQSANALLKTLEEPPRTSHLILITSRPAMLLATVRSRCQVIRFSPSLWMKLSSTFPGTRVPKHRRPACVRDLRVAVSAEHSGAILRVINPTGPSCCECWKRWQSPVIDISS